MEGTHDNENEKLTFSKIGLQAALILNRLRVTAQLLELNEKKDEQGESDPQPARSDEQKRDEQRRYVEHRLAELAKWEQRIRDGRMRVKRR